MSGEEERYPDAEILRHDDFVRDFRSPPAESLMEEVCAHMDAIGIAQDSVFHEVISDLIHLDVHVSRPSRERPFVTLFTTGMSDLPMAAPEGWEEFARAELMVCLPKDWRLDAESQKDPRWFWPMRLLKFLARFPHRFETWLAEGHTLPNGDPAEPYAEGTELSCVLLQHARRVPEGAEVIETSKGPVHLYGIVPLHPDETDLKLREGLEGLAPLLEKRGVDELLDPKRRSVLRRKRFGLF